MQDGNGAPSVSDRETHGPGGDDGGAGSPSPRRIAGRTLVLSVVVALLAMWGYVTYLAFFEGRQPPVDRIEDPAFARAAEARCARALDRVDALPLATESSTPDGRADVLDQANATFESMLADLEAMTELVPEGDDRDRTDAWLADWGTFLEDREGYANALRTDPDARMLVSEKAGEGRHITGWIDEFARANRMPSCVSPTDA